MSILLVFLKLQRFELGFFKLGLAQSREDPPGLTKCLGLLKIKPLEVRFKLFEFSRQNQHKLWADFGLTLGDFGYSR